MKKANIAESSHKKRMKLYDEISNISDVDQQVATSVANVVIQRIYPIIWCEI